MNLSNFYVFCTLMFHTILIFLIIITKDFYLINNNIKLVMLYNLVNIIGKATMGDLNRDLCTQNSKSVA